MNGYVKTKASEVPFYISLAEDGIKKYDDANEYWKTELAKFKPSKFKWNKPYTWFADENDYYNIKYKEENYYDLSCRLIMIKDMLIKAKDRDIYINVDSFDLLEKENV